MVNSCELGRATRKLNDIDADEKKTGKGKAAEEEKRDKSPKRKTTTGKSPPKTRSPPRK